MAEWKQAYLNYLDNFTGADSFVYSLIYVDDDAIPELVIDSGFGKRGYYGGWRLSGTVDVSSA